MSVTGILIAAAIVGGTGLIIGVFLGFANRVFAVEVDEKEEAILNVLPGNNCGGCGYAGCANLAAAIAKGEADVGACPVGGTPVANEISAIMGVEAGDAVRMVAVVKCAGNVDVAKPEYNYYGLQDCVMLNMMQDAGPKTCNHGCLGGGSCTNACPFDAIHVVNGVAVVNKDVCKGCSKCISVCPKQLIELVPYDQAFVVRCSSRDRGKDTTQACSAGCIGCKMCEKVCESDAIHVENNRAHIDPTKCTNCGKCAEKCPKKIIISNG